MKTYIFLLIFFILKVDAGFCQTNPNATQTTKNVYNYLKNLAGESNRVLIGQNCYHGSQIYTYGYNQLFKGLYDATGKWASLLSVDYEYEKIYTAAELHNCNLKLIEHWKAGGLVTINWTPRHPNGGDTRVKIDPQDLSILFTRPDWKARIDVIAAALKELQDAGVVVLFRPMQEMNNDWFWYASWRTLNPADPQPYKTHWINLYNYLTETKGLNNLLWVYSPNEYYAPSWTKPVDFHYPGVNYVDIVAPTVYKDDLSIPDYAKLKNLGKPMGIAEFGTTYKNAIGTIDTRKYINKIRSTYPDIKYFVCWHNWSGVSLALVSNKYTPELMNDPWAITRDEVNYSIQTDISGILVSQEKDTFYPNPVNDALLISLRKSFQNSDCVVNLYGIDGCLLKKETFHGNTYQLNMSGFSKGIYLLKIDTPNEKITKQIIKE